MATITSRLNPLTVFNDLNTSFGALNSTLASYTRPSSTSATITFLSNTSLDGYLLRITGTDLPSPPLSLFFPASGSITKIEFSRVSTPTSVLATWDGDGSSVLLSSLVSGALSGSSALLNVFLTGTDTLKSFFNPVDITGISSLENISLQGASLEGIGNLLNNTITGNNLNNRLTGGGGNDTLNGGFGSDTYRFDTDLALGSDTLSDTAATGADTLDFSDTTTRTINFDLRLFTAQAVNAGLTLSFAAGSRFENIIGGALNDTFTGNALSNFIWGLAGNDTIDGGGGNDTINGGTGNDTYRFDTDGAGGSDTLVEAAVPGIDTLDFSATTTRNVAINLGLLGPQVVNAGLTLTIAAGGPFENITGGGLNDTLTGNLFNNTIRGLSGNDTLNGSGGNDVLDGGIGNDLLIGGAGNDTLTGGTIAADRFRFDAPLNASNVDIITDFTVAEGDRIELENSVFTQLTPGTPLAASAFRVGVAAITPGQFILYNSTNGVLSYDSDGSGLGAAVAFAKLSPGLALTNASFTVT